MRLRPRPKPESVRPRPRPKKSCEAEDNIYEDEAMRPATTMHLHSTTKKFIFFNT